MEKNQNPKRDDPEQSKRFEETAKSLGVDKNAEAFDKAFSAVTAKKSKTAPKKSKL